MTEPDGRPCAPLPDVVDVLIVGTGPTGLAAANFLGCRGVRVLVVEKDDGLSALPRAVSVDDETMRALQSAGLEAAAHEIVLEGTGTKYYGARGQLLTYARSPHVPPLGHAAKNPIDQPEFDRMLFDGLTARASVDVRFSTSLEALTDLAAARVVLRTGRRTHDLTARFVVAADGGRSTVRRLVGATMAGSSFSESWLVVDTIEDPHDERYAMHHGDPARPHVIVPGRDGRCRYEFLLLPGEDPEETTQLPFVRRLLAHYRSDLQPEHLKRIVVYTFHALVAERWRHGSIFLAGDAAHMMPPFAGQGLNSGLRDAHNLAWKLEAVLAGRAGEGLLDSYEEERRPHATAMIRLSNRLGKVVMTTSPRRARIRDLSFSALAHVPPLARYFSEMRFKPAPRFRAGLLVTEDGDGSGLAGAMLPQPEVLLPDGARKRLDDVLGEDFALVGVDCIDALIALQSPLWAQLGARRVALALGDRRAPATPGLVSVADADDRLGGLLGDQRGQIVLVRPDRYVVGAFAPSNEVDFATRVIELLGEQSPVQPAPPGRPAVPDPPVQSGQVAARNWQSDAATAMLAPDAWKEGSGR